VRGHDITGESLEWGDRPKIIITGYASSGFDVQNTVKRVGATAEVNDGTVHYNGSILAFPFACFLWNVASIDDVTIEMLAPVVLLHRPKLEYLLLGCPGSADRNRLSQDRLAALQQALRPIVVEQMGISNAIGTFNILNAEDRPAAVALIIDRDGKDEVEDD
jgi:uncharacterized protein